VSLVEKHPSEPAPGQSKCAGNRVAPDPGGTVSHGRLGSRYLVTSLSSKVLFCYGAIPELDEASIRPTRDPPPGWAGDWAEATLLLVQDRDRIAAGMNDLVVHRLFAAGLALETALGLMGGHPGAGKVQEALGELELAIWDVRNVVFDHQQPDPLSGRQPG